MTWNARVEDGDRRLSSMRRPERCGSPTSLSVPDTGHRHLAYFDLVEWNEHPSEIPQQVTVDDVPVSGDEIRNCSRASIRSRAGLLRGLPVTTKMEGRLYDEFNADSKPPSRAVAIDLNQQKTPTRRFVYALMDRC